MTAWCTKSTAQSIDRFLFYQLKRWWANRRRNYPWASATQHARAEDYGIAEAEKIFPLFRDVISQRRQHRSWGRRKTLFGRRQKIRTRGLNLFLRHILFSSLWQAGRQKDSQRYPFIFYYSSFDWACVNHFFSFFCRPPKSSSRENPELATAFLSCLSCPDVVVVLVG